MAAPAYANYVISGDKLRWGADKGVKLGDPVKITFSFANQNVHNLTYSNLQPFTDTQMTAVRAAFAYIESFTKIDFVETATNTGNLQFLNGDIGAGEAGVAPNVSYGNGGYAWGVVVMNNRDGWRQDNKSYTPGEITKADVGGTAWQTLLHEIAHTIGIKHPHQANAAGDADSIMPASMDNLTQSSMSYTSYAHSTVTVREIQPDGRHFFFPGTLKPTGFGMTDIAALQYLYGTNTSSTGNKVYAFQPDKPIYVTISDNGPNNTVDVSALKGTNRIDLTPGKFSDLAIRGLYDETISSGAYDGTRALATGYGVNVANVIGGSGVDHITGNGIANALFGKNGADTLLGGIGNDHLYGGNSGDRLDGGSGADYARYDDANYGNLVISLIDPSKNTGAAKGDTYAGIEGVIGGVGNDTITGNNGSNTLQGGAGNDTLNGGIGTDKLDGGVGNDTFTVDNVGDKVIELANGGTDRVFASVAYTLAANVENLTLTGSTAIKGTGNTLANAITGNTAANIINGGTNADTMTGLAGDDTYIVDNIGDKVVEASNQGTDTVQSSVFFSLAGQALENLTLTGSAAIGGTGNSGANTIIGNTAANILDGSTGMDILTGRSGADSFTFASTLSAGNIDRITDFTVVDDTIRIDRSFFGSIALGTLSASLFKDVGVTGAVVDADDRFLYSSKTGRVFYDADGSGTGAAVHFATLDNKALLTAVDFFIVA